MTTLQEETDIRLWTGQEKLLENYKKREQAVIAGWGYGKSTFGVKWHSDRVLINNESRKSLVVAPDHKLVKQVCFDMYVDYLVNTWGLKEKRHFKLNLSDLIIKLFWKGMNHQIIFMTAEAPVKITGHTASHAWMDESGRCKKKARENLISRIRCPKSKALQLLDTSTPEGFNFLYNIYNPANMTRTGNISESESKLLLHGSSFDNPELPDSFFDNMKELYGWDSDLWLNYVEGEFTNLSQNKFYYGFNEMVNSGEYNFEPDIKTFTLSWDNNVGQMTWAVIQNQFGEWRVTNDNGGRGRNIEDSCNQFIDKFNPMYFRDYHINILGDAALHQRSTHSYQTGYDIIEQLLQKHYNNVTMSAPISNPLIEERSRSTNRLFKLKRLKINRSCKKVLESVRMAETDGRGKIKKTSTDTVTHAMEAVDMAMLVLDPPPTRYKPFGVTY